MVRSVDRSDSDGDRQIELCHMIWHYCLNCDTIEPAQTGRWTEIDPGGGVWIEYRGDDNEQYLSCEYDRADNGRCNYISYRLSYVGGRRNTFIFWYYTGALHGIITGIRENNEYNKKVENEIFEGIASDIGWCRLYDEDGFLYAEGKMIIGWDLWGPSCWQVGDWTYYDMNGNKRIMVKDYGRDW